MFWPTPTKNSFTPEINKKSSFTPKLLLQIIPPQFPITPQPVSQFLRWCKGAFSLTKARMLIQSINSEAKEKAEV